MRYSQAFNLSSSSGCPFKNLLAEVDLLRIVASHKLEQSRKEAMGQFLTPLPVAELMAGNAIAALRPQASRLVVSATGSRSLIAHLTTLGRLRPDVVHVNLCTPWACAIGLFAALTLPNARVVRVDQLPLRTLMRSPCGVPGRYRCGWMHTLQSAKQVRGGWRIFTL